MSVTIKDRLTMTLDVEPTRLAPRSTRTITRRASVLLVALAALMLGCVGYLARYGECNVHSQYCVVSIAGTRSEVGFTWDTWDFYVSTYPDNGNVVTT